MSQFPVEATWLFVNGLTAGLTVLSLRDAYKARRAVVALNGRAREIVAAGNVRREWLRLAVQVLLLTLGAWAWVVPGETVLSPFVVLLMAVAVLLCVSTVFDARDRRELLELVATRG